MSIDKQKGEIILQPIEEGLKKHYLTYAMSVIIGRYIPDVRDGLKPVHRRILYSMYENNLVFSSKPRKSAKVVGDVLGNYHPHGDTAVYDALVRMAQDFAMRYPLIVGQGNFGSIDGDPPAAMRYTESRLAKLSEMLIEDIKEDTVEFIPNYDNTNTEPVVLPTRYPNLLVNGSIGIAVAMSTNIPPHNIHEVVHATIELVNNPDATTEDLMQHLKAPDFPTAGIIMGTEGIKKAYETGKGSFIVRGRTEIETLKKGGKTAIIITEIPYGIKKAALIMDIAAYVKDDVIKGISEIRDESNKDGMRVVMELKKGIDPDVLLNQLYQRTQLQISISMNLLAIVDREPKLMGIKEILTYFIAHRKVVIIRRAEFRLRKANARFHIVEGLLTAIDNLDEVIKMIRASSTAQEAKIALKGRFELSDIQVQAILELRLQKLVALERLSLEEEKKELLDIIGKLMQLLASEEEQYNLIKEELEEVVRTIKTVRKTEIQAGIYKNMSMEDVIPNHNWLIMISTEGILKRTALDAYRTQRRGGQGKIGAQVRGEEQLRYVFNSKAHDYILVFTNFGSAYYIRTYEIPESTPTSRGKSIQAIIPFKPGEKIASVLHTDSLTDKNFVLFTTKKGMVKKTALSEFVNAKKRGIIAISLREGDELLHTTRVAENDELFLATAQGKALRTDSNNIRPLGRSALGVIGMKLRKDDEIVGVEIVNAEATLLVMTQNGFGKRMPYTDFTPHGRGTQGQFYQKVTAKTGKVVAVSQIANPEYEALILTQNGIATRIAAKDISLIDGKNTQGVIVVRPKNNDIVVDCTILAQQESTLEVEDTLL